MNLIVKAWNNIVGVALMSIELMWTDPSKLKSIVELLRKMSLPGVEWRTDKGRINLYSESVMHINRSADKVGEYNIVKITDVYLVRCIGFISKALLYGIILSGVCAYFFDLFASGTDMWSLYIGGGIGVWVGYCSLIYEWSGKRVVNIEMVLNKANMELLQTKYYRDIVAKREADEFKKLLGSVFCVKKSIMAL